MADIKPTSDPADEIELAKEQQLDATRNAYHDVSDEFPTRERKKVLFKMDIRILPMLMLLYCKCFDAL